MQTYPVLPAILMLVSFGVRQASAEIVEVPVKNPSFERGLTKDGAPVGWLVYGGLGKKTRFALVDDADEGKKALLIDDGDPEKPFGIYQKVVAQEGLTYETSVRVRGVPGASSFSAAAISPAAGMVWVEAEGLCPLATTTASRGDMSAAC